MIRDEILEALQSVLGKGVSVEIAVPERAEFGHYSTSVALRLAKEEKKNPVALAGEIAEKLRTADAKKKAGKNLFEKVEVAPPGFVNMWIAKGALQNELQEIIKKKSKAPESKTGKGKKIIVEYASLNVAKPMHVGHLRNVVIGDALANCFEAAGYKVTRWNYLGDWGTQFGKIIAAYKKWGSKEEMASDPIGTLTALYVRFHKEAKENDALNDEARAEFKKLEEGDKENRKLWEWFKKESLKVFAQIEKRLGISFDTEIGESFFEKEMKPITEDLLKKGIAIRSEGAVIVPLDLDGANLPPAMLEKSDGASTYLARDLALLRYRLAKYKPERILHVIGNEQSLHMSQVFATARLMGLYKASEESVHVKYGLVLGETGKKFSSREGEVVSAIEVVDRVVALAAGVVEEKNRDLSEREKKDVAEAVALGALKYANLKENRNSDIVFDWEKMLDFTGESAPYIQYTYARLQSIQRKAGKTKGDVKLLIADLPLSIVRKMIELPCMVARTAETYAPNMLALYLYELAALANNFYETTPIMKDENVSQRGAHLALIGAVAVSLQSGLKLLGIDTPEKI
jgi:arginyl-tRNA synthetase